ncbi:hypothetical protein, partial [Providencia sp. NPDC089923]|uniref:hypothetical protein n=1 Tax=Providencia sp. NPDC089923 TaxID=3415004 RepID=UPI003C306772
SSWGVREINKLNNSIISKLNAMKEYEKQFFEIAEENQKQKLEDRQVQKNIEANTKRIAENTEWLTQSVNLIRINNEKQTELLSFITEVLALANETDRDIAESKLRKIVNRVQGFKENYELATFLKEMGEGIINLISNS